MKKITILILFALICVNSPCFAATLTSHADRNSIEAGETFNLTLSIDEKKTNTNPDLKPLLQDFEILATTKSSELSVINGKTLTQTQWIFTLAPKHSGTITIPALNLGQLQSQPLKIKVNSSKSPTTKNTVASKLFLEATANPTDPYLQSQVIYTVRIFTAGSMQSGSLTDPILPNGVVVKLGEDINYETVRNGQPYSVIERRYAIFPQSSGNLTIAPPILTGQVAALNKARIGLNTLFVTDTKAIRLAAPAIKLHVRPKAPVFEKKLWLPAQKLQIAESWSINPPEFRVGEPITRTIMLTAEGMRGEQLPPLAPINIQNANTYPAQPIIKTLTDNPDTVNGVRMEKMTFIPTQPGNITLPAMTITWWNTKTNQAQVASLPAVNFNILPTTTSATNPNIITGATTVNIETTSEQTTPPVILWWEKISYGTWMLGILFIAWIITLFAWWRQKRHTRILAGGPTVRSLAKTARDHIRAARTPEETKIALLDWATTIWPDKKFQTLGDIVDQLDNSPLKSAIKVLDALLYANTIAKWDPAQFWEIFVTHAPRVSPTEKKATDENLPPLYPTS